MVQLVGPSGDVKRQLPFRLYNRQLLMARSGGLLQVFHARSLAVFGGPKLSEGPEGFTCQKFEAGTTVRLLLLGAESGYPPPAKLPRLSA